MFCFLKILVRIFLNCATQETVRLLVFDCLVVDDQNVMSRPLDKRYGVSQSIMSSNLVSEAIEETEPMVLQAVCKDDT